MKGNTAVNRLKTTVARLARRLHWLRAVQALTAIALFSILIVQPMNPSSHPPQTVTLTRTMMVNVISDFHAKGDGKTDDTRSIQAAIDRVYQNGGGVVLFPPKTYLVKSINLRENITYQGYGATLKRPARQGKWTRTFTTEHTQYKGNVDSRPLIIKGFTFDGNSKQQGAYRNYELEQAHLIFLEGNRDAPGRLTAIIQDCTFKNGVADAISVYTNVNVKVYNCTAIDVFRGGFVLTGGYSIAEVKNLTTRGKIDNTGIDIEVDGRGYGNTLKVAIKFDNLNLIDGDFDVGLEAGSTIEGNNIVANAPFELFSRDSTMKFTNSTFRVGAADEKVNIIVFPHAVTFENCKFYVTRKKTGRPYRFFSAADVWWQHSGYPTQRDQSLVYRNCVFELDQTIQPTDVTYAIYLREDAPKNHNRLVLDRCRIGPRFKAAIANAKGIVHRQLPNPISKTLGA